MERESELQTAKVAGEGVTVPRKSMLWGLFLIAIGLVFLLERFGVLEVPALGRLWPIVFIVIGISRAFERRYGGALMFTLMGAWFLACTFDWMGLTFRNSWGLVLVAVGGGMVVRSLTGEDERGRRGKEAGHA